jgi:hypothetical protein
MAGGVGAGDRVFLETVQPARGNVSLGA